MHTPFDIHTIPSTTSWIKSLHKEDLIQQCRAWGIPIGQETCDHMRVLLRGFVLNYNRALSSTAGTSAVTTTVITDPIVSAPLTTMSYLPTSDHYHFNRSLLEGYGRSPSPHTPIGPRGRPGSFMSDEPLALPFQGQSSLSIIPTLDQGNLPAQPITSIPISLYQPASTHQAMSQHHVTFAPNVFSQFYPRPSAVTHVTNMHLNSTNPSSRRVPPPIPPRLNVTNPVMTQHAPRATSSPPYPPIPPRQHITPSNQHIPSTNLPPFGPPAITLHHDILPPRHRDTIIGASPPHNPYLPSQIITSSTPSPPPPAYPPPSFSYPGIGYQDLSPVDPPSSPVNILPYQHFNVPSTIQQPTSCHPTFHVPHAHSTEVYRNQYLPPQSQHCFPSVTAPPPRVVSPLNFPIYQPPLLHTQHYPMVTVPNSYGNHPTTTYQTRSAYVPPPQTHHNFYPHNFSPPPPSPPPLFPFQAPTRSLQPQPVPSPSPPSPCNQIASHQHEPCLPPLRDINSIEPHTSQLTPAHHTLLKDKQAFKVLDNFLKDIGMMNGSDVIQFVEQLNKLNAAFELGLISDRNFIVYALPHTSGYLNRVWLEAVRNKDTWAQLASRVQSEFLPARTLRKVINDTIYRLQRPQENLNAFIADITNKAQLLLPHLGEKDVVDIIVQNINPSTRRTIVFQASPTTLEELYTLARAVNEVTFAEREYRTTFPDQRMPNRNNRPHHTPNNNYNTNNNNFKPRHYNNYHRSDNPRQPREAPRNSFLYTAPTTSTTATPTTSTTSQPNHVLQPLMARTIKPPNKGNYQNLNRK